MILQLDDSSRYVYYEVTKRKNSKYEGCRHWIGDLSNALLPLWKCRFLSSGSSVYHTA